MTIVLSSAFLFSSLVLFWTCGLGALGLRWRRNLISGYPDYYVVAVLVGWMAFNSALTSGNSFKDKKMKLTIPFSLVICWVCLELKSTPSKSRADGIDQHTIIVLSNSTLYSHNS